jgi:hypothetical protein
MASGELRRIFASVLPRVGRAQRGEPGRQAVLEDAVQRRGVAVEQEAGADHREADQRQRNGIKKGIREHPLGEMCR